MDRRTQLPTRVHVVAPSTLLVFWTFSPLLPRKDTLCFQKVTESWQKKPARMEDNRTTVPETELPDGDDSSQISAPSPPLLQARSVSVVRVSSIRSGFALRIKAFVFVL